MTQTLDVLNLMADGELMNSARVSEAIGCELKSAQNTLFFLCERGFIGVEVSARYDRRAEYRITPLGMKRAKFQPKVNNETAKEREARLERTAKITDAALDALFRQRAQQEARGAVEMAVRGAIPNSVFALGSMS